MFSLPLVIVVNLIVFNQSLLYKYPRRWHTLYAWGQHQVNKVV